MHASCAHTQIHTHTRFHNTFMPKDDERSKATMAAATITAFLLHVWTHITHHATTDERRHSNPHMVYVRTCIILCSRAWWLWSDFEIVHTKFTNEIISISMQHKIVFYSFKCDAKSLFRIKREAHKITDAMKSFTTTTTTTINIPLYNYIGMRVHWHRRIARRKTGARRRGSIKKEKQ